MNTGDELFEVAYEDRLSEVQRLLEAEPTLIACRRIGGRTPLHQAAFGGASQVCQFLISKGADINAKTDYAWTPLHYAAAANTSTVAEILLQGGAKPTIANDDGYTALHFAVDFGKESLVQLLVANGADLNAKDRQGKTALDLAEPSSTMFSFLENHGANRGEVQPESQPHPLPEFLVDHAEELDELANTVERQWNAQKKRPQ